MKFLIDNFLRGEERGRIK